MGWWRRWWGTGRATEGATLYDALVARARDPDWYVAGGVPDTMDGRFAMVATVVAFALLRLEEDPAGRAASARLTERFVDDMDGQLRQIGIGDVVVGKHVGRMMGLLGGMTGAYRDARRDGALEPALARNLYPDAVPAPAAVAHAANRLRALAAELTAVPTDTLIAGRLA